MTKKEKSPFGLRAVNDYYIIEEESIELTVDKKSGLTQDVIDALESKRIVLPEISEGFADKFPFRGKVVSKGDKTKYEEIQPGTRVMFARLGGMRWNIGDKQYVNLKESDLHAIID